MAQIRFADGVRVGSSIVVESGTTVSPGWTRSQQQQESLAEFVIPMESWRVHDAFHTLLPGTSAADDLGLIGGTFGTGVPSLQTYDVKTVGATTLYARTTLSLPVEYDAAQDVVLRFRAGMLTTVADTTATIDVSAYLSDSEGAVSGSDLVTTGATTINSLTLADIDFTVTSASLSAGSVLDIRVAVAINDGASGTAVQGIIGKASMLCDIRG